MLETIEWTPQGVVMIDQTLLPSQIRYETCTTYLEVANAIKTMIIRGAPAIGVAAAMGVAIGVQKSENPDADFSTICETLAATRPTAVNLFWGIERMKRVYNSLNGESIETKRQTLIDEAIKVREEDIAICKEIGRHGASLVPDNKTVLTHCNAGALATAGYGTALGVIRGEPSPPPVTEPRSASFAPPGNPAKRLTFSPTKPARFFKAPGSRPGN
jgi:methylthioribose-1-phosphate isomerase